MERVQKRVFEIYEKATSLGYKLELENRENLNVLNEKPADPAVLYSNHATWDDMFLIINVLQKESPESLGNIVLPVSEHHTHFQNNPVYTLAVKAGRLQGFTIPEIVQSYRTRNDEEDNQLEEKGGTLNLRLARVLQEKLTGGARVLIFPEGHRSGNQTLLPAESGIGYMATVINNLKKREKIENGYFIPWGIVFDNPKGQGSHFNPIKRPDVKIVIGKPLEVESIIEESEHYAEKPQQTRVASHVLMHHLAEHLPENMQGVYNKNLFEDTVNGRFEQRIDEKGKVYVYDKKESAIWRK